MKRHSIQVLNPGPGATMHKKHYRRHTRRNPSGNAAASAAAHTAGKIIAGAVTTFVGKKILGMKKADGTQRLSPKQQLLAQGVVAVAAAAGGSMVDNKIAADVLDGTAIVMGGDAALQAATLYNVEGQARGLIPGMQQQAQANAALPAPPQTAPGGYLYADAGAWTPARN